MKKIFLSLFLALVLALSSCTVSAPQNSVSDTESLTESTDTQSESESESETDIERKSLQIGAITWEEFWEKLDSNKNKIDDHTQEKIALMSRRIDMEEYPTKWIQYYEPPSGGWQFYVQWWSGIFYVDISYYPNGYTRAEFLEVLDEENQIYWERHANQVYIYYSDTLCSRINIKFAPPYSWTPEQEAIFEMLKEYALENLRIVSQWEQGGGNAP